MSDLQKALVVMTCAAAIFVYLTFRFARLNRRLRADNRWYSGQIEELLNRRPPPVQAPARPAPPPRRIWTDEERAAMDRADDVDRLTKQLADVQSDSVAFSKQRIMSSNGEVALFYAARTVTGQTAPNGDYPFYVFPQVSLGELVRTSPKTPSAARRSKDAYLAINSKRCDIVLADNTGLPVAVFEYQGAGHHSGTASLRDEVKRLAVTRAGTAPDRTKSGR